MNNENILITGINKDWYINEDHKLEHLDRDLALLCSASIRRNATAEEVILHTVKTYIHGIDNNCEKSIQRKINSVIGGLLVNADEMIKGVK